MENFNCFRKAALQIQSAHKKFKESAEQASVDIEKARKEIAKIKYKCASESSSCFEQSTKPASREIEILKLAKELETDLRILNLKSGSVYNRIAEKQKENYLLKQRIKEKERYLKQINECSCACLLF